MKKILIGILKSSLKRCCFVTNAFEIAARVGIIRGQYLFVPAVEIDLDDRHPKTSGILDVMGKHFSVRKREHALPKAGNAPAPS